MHVTGQVCRAVFAALVYADIFDFPLRPTEVHRYLPACHARLDEVESALRDWPSLAGLYYLPGRDELPERRLTREREAERLWQLALRYGRWLQALPFVEMVGVT